MGSTLVPPSDPREIEALDRIAEIERAARSQARWSWAVLVPLVVRMLGAFWVIWGAIAIGLDVFTARVTGATIARSSIMMVLGITIVVSATWGYRYAHQRAFGQSSRPGL